MKIDSVLEKLRLLQLLVNDKGATSGEAQSAKNAIDRLLTKYNLSMDDLLDQQTKEYTYKYRTNAEKSVIVLSACRALGDYPDGYIDKSKKTIVMTLTHSEFVDVDQIVSVMLDAWRGMDKELKREQRLATERMKMAFIMKNNLGTGKDDSSDDNGNSGLSMSEIIDIVRMMRDMDTVSVNRAIGDGG